MRKKILLICAITFLGAALRFYQLGQVPPSLNWDEVSWGYNAYSVLTTGKGEFGSAFPLSFKAFGDYKQPFYVYSQILPIISFGLTAFAVRFPSAFFGTLSIPFVHLLTKELFPKYKDKEKLSLLASFLFALSPWSIQFSRVAFEANVATFFIISGVYLLLKGINDKKFLYLFLSLIVLSVSAYTYHSAKIFTPLLVASLFLLHYKYFLSVKKIAVAAALVFLLANSLWLFDMRTTARGRSVLFTSQQTEILKRSIPMIAQDKEGRLPITHLIHNRRIVYANKYLQNYLSHFDPNFLFIKGDNPRHHAPGMGVLYLTLLPAIILGIFRFFEIKEKKKWILFIWLLLAPLASSLAQDAPNASRSLVFLPTWQIFAALGTLSIFSKLKKRKILQLFLVLLFLSNVIYFLHMYFKHTNTQYAIDWQYGYRQAVEFARQKDEIVYFTPNVEQAYIFYLFHTEYPPEKYLDKGGSKIRENKCFSIENAYFGDCQISENHFVVTTEEKEKEKIVKKIKFPNGEEALNIYMVNTK